MTDVYSMGDQIPWIAALTYIEKIFVVDKAFGNRSEPLANKGLGSFSIGAFTVIDGHIWFGSPYNDRIHVYNTQGLLLGTIAGHHIDALGKNDFDKLKPGDKKGRNKLFIKNRTFSILQAGPLVVVKMIKYYDIYDKNGNLLRKNIKRNNVRPFLSSNENEIYTDILPMDTGEYYNPNDLNILKNRGWYRQDNDDNPYIRIGRLIN